MIASRRLPRFSCFVPLLFAGLAPPLAAAPALGPQIQVNVSTLDVNYHPQAAVFPDGGFIVVWTAQAKAGPGANRAVIHARSFDPDGSPASGEFLLLRDARVNAVAAAGLGRFVLAYNDGYLQVFSRAGTPLTAPVLVHRADPDFVDYDFVVGVGANGHIAAAWASAGTQANPGNCLTNSYARIFSRRLVPLTGTLLLDEGSNSDCSGPQPDAVALSPGDDLFAVLTCVCDGIAVYAASIDSNGKRLLVDGFGSIDSIGYNGYHETYNGSMAVASDGRRVVVYDYWPSPGQVPAVASPAVGISGRVFDAGGHFASDQFTVQRHLVGTLTSPQIAWVGTRQTFVAIWIADAGQNGVATDIFGRLLAADGTPHGRDFRVASLPVVPGQAPGLALAGGGANAVAVWTVNSPSTVYARVITLP